MTHRTHLPPLRAFQFPLATHLRHTCSPSPPPPRLSPAPVPRWPTPLRARAFGESIRGGAEPPGSTLDALLSGAELLCLAPPAICSAVCAVRLIVARGGSVKPFAAVASGRMFVLQYVLLVGAVAVGVLVRRKQWERLCRVGAGGSASATGGVDLVGRVEKVEESVRVVLAAVVVLSRTVEKLGVRFRVLRRTVTDPISESHICIYMFRKVLNISMATTFNALVIPGPLNATRDQFKESHLPPGLTATLAEKNSEATRILAAQGNLLEKEIGSIQKVLYAMQEQQEKQLELILAIGEASRILDEQDFLGQETAISSSSAPDYANIRDPNIHGTSDF
ncbi:uncharacterized protein [Triticum aestivum]|uniref:uncharacterized protein isoform X1 n=1 Tax=Triticum aestivum TaxID=4565 RepID=UPI001D01AE33|nr:uncharacterized protein LOC123158425 isoform X1 [Triticum aestivum]